MTYSPTPKDFLVDTMKNFENITKSKYVLGDTMKYYEVLPPKNLGTSVLLISKGTATEHVKQCPESNHILMS